MLTVEIVGSPDARERAVGVPLRDRDCAMTVPYPCAGLKLGAGVRLETRLNNAPPANVFVLRAIREKLPRVPAPEPVEVDAELVGLLLARVQEFGRELHAFDPRESSIAVFIKALAFGLPLEFFARLPVSIQPDLDALRAEGVPPAWVEEGREIADGLRARRMADEAAKERARREEEEARRPIPIPLGESFIALTWDPNEAPECPPVMRVPVGYGMSEARTEVVSRWPFRAAPPVSGALTKFDVTVRTSGTVTLPKCEYEKLWYPPHEIIEVILKKRVKGVDARPIGDGEFGDGFLSTLVGRAKRWHFERNVLASLEPAHVVEWPTWLHYAAEAGVRGYLLHPQIVAASLERHMGEPARERFEQAEKDVRARLRAGDRDGLPDRLCGRHADLDQQVTYLTRHARETLERELEALRGKVEHAVRGAQARGAFFSPGSLWSKTAASEYKDVPLEDEEDAWTPVLRAFVEGLDEHGRPRLQIHRSQLWDVLDAANADDRPSDGAPTQAQTRRLRAVMGSLGFEVKAARGEHGLAKYFVRPGQS